MVIRGLDLRTWRPASNQPPLTLGDRYLIFQGMFFILEAVVIALVLSFLAWMVSFSTLSLLLRWIDIERGTELAITIAAGLIALAALILSFIGYFILLGDRIFGHVICALGSLIWALPFAVIVPMLTRPVLPQARHIVPLVSYLAAAAVIYRLKRRAVRAQAPSALLRSAPPQ